MTANDNNLQWIDANGVTWFKYSVTYKHNGHTFTLDIPATSLEDCEARIVSIFKTAEVDRVYGEIMA